MITNTNVARMKNKTTQKNNQSGHTGVSWHSGQGRWLARITFKKKTYNLGYFDSFELAVRARERAEKLLVDRYVNTLENAKSIRI